MNEYNNLSVHFYQIMNIIMHFHFITTRTIEEGHKPSKLPIKKHLH